MELICNYSLLYTIRKHSGERKRVPFYLSLKIRAVMCATPFLSGMRCCVSEIPLSEVYRYVLVTTLNTNSNALYALGCHGNWKC